jgi:hypothetical protein
LGCLMPEGARSGPSSKDGGPAQLRLDGLVKRLRFDGEALEWVRDALHAAMPTNARVQRSSSSDGRI